ncbi:hypothetical protein CJ255_00145 [Candidatus Viridilinea mediisalina]|uniref:Uncharacterized protein n=2 Tax=Candidatus Viridilinea mediisalina TaxID=2024553 RepID=A0A2A6RQ24_9CHLR|nr:hypothetical protein CJ255_00145 [Candidatus Viridilinea mediisalina]
MRVTTMQDVLAKTFTDQQRSDLEAYVRDFIACSFMTRSKDIYSFSHRSLSEYLAARALSLEIEHNVPDLLRSDQLTGAVRDWIIDIYRDQGQPQWLTTLWDWVDSTKQQLEAKAQFLGGNALSLLHAFGASLIKRDFIYTYLKGAELAHANLHHAKFNHCTLKNSNLTAVNARTASFQSTKMDGVNLTDAVLIKTNFGLSTLRNVVLTNAQIDQANLHSCRFDDVTWHSARIGGSRIAGTELEKYLKEKEIVRDDNSENMRFSKPETRTYHCFLKGTRLLMATREMKAIEDIVVGDIVLSFCFETKEIVESKVSELFRGDTAAVVTINQCIHTTPSEAFASAERWVLAGDLQIGDTLRTLDGWVRVVSLETKQQPSTVYNLTAQPYHNFFVEGVLVHNMPRYQKSIQ